MPRYHAFWSGVSAQDLMWVDNLCCHGNFRTWATAAFHFLEASQGEGIPGHFTRDLMRSVLESLDSTVRDTDDTTRGYL